MVARLAATIADNKIIVPRGRLPLLGRAAGAHHDRVQVPLPPSPQPGARHDVVCAHCYYYAIVSSYSITFLFCQT